MSEIKKGKYKHFKGKEYEVIGTATDSDTLEEVVVYKALYESKEHGKDAMWVRPKSQFLECVVIEGKAVPRFKHLG